MQNPDSKGVTSTKREMTCPKAPKKRCTGSKLRPARRSAIALIVKDRALSKLIMLLNE
jgi:hypothetical protein